MYFSSSQMYSCLPLQNVCRRLQDFQISIGGTRAPTGSTFGDFLARNVVGTVLFIMFMVFLVPSCAIHWLVSGWRCVKGCGRGGVSRVWPWRCVKGVDMEVCQGVEVCQGCGHGGVSRVWSWRCVKGVAMEVCQEAYLLYFCDHVTTKMIYMFHPLYLSSMIGSTTIDI